MRRNTTPNCNACMRLAARRGVAIGSKLRLRGRTGKVLAINHSHDVTGGIFCMIETAEGVLSLPLKDVEANLA